MMIYRIHFFIHYRGSYRYYIIQLFYWYYSSWYLLCCSSLPLCFIHRSSICNYCQIHSLISSNLRIFNKSILFKYPIYIHIYRSKPNFLPSTLPRIKRYTTSILRLSRQLSSMKHYLFYRFINFNFKTNYFNIHYLRITFS